MKDEFAQMTVKQLKSLMTSSGIQIPNKSRKADLLRILRRARSPTLRKSRKTRKSVRKSRKTRKSVRKSRKTRKSVRKSRHKHRLKYKNDYKKIWDLVNEKNAKLIQKNKDDTWLPPQPDQGAFPPLKKAPRTERELMQNEIDMLGKGYGPLETTNPRIKGIEIWHQGVITLMDRVRFEKINEMIKRWIKDVIKQQKGRREGYKNVDEIMKCASNAYNTYIDFYQPYFQAYKTKPNIQQKIDFANMAKKKFKKKYNYKDDENIYLNIKKIQQLYLVCFIIAIKFYELNTFYLAYTLSSYCDGVCNIQEMSDIELDVMDILVKNQGYFCKSYKKK